MQLSIMAISISMSLPDDLYTWLEKLAEQKGKTLQQVIRELLYEMKMWKEEKLDELFIRMELILRKLK